VIVMAKSKKDVEGGLGIHARRAIAYIVLIIISFFCLFWFYIMFINATRSKGELKAGFTALPSDHLLTNWNNLVHGTLPIWSGMFNSLIIAAATAVLCVYFSTMTAYAIHAYDFKLKKFIYPFIHIIQYVPHIGHAAPPAQSVNIRIISAQHNKRPPAKVSIARI